MHSFKNPGPQLPKCHWKCKSTDFWMFICAFNINLGKIRLLGDSTLFGFLIGIISRYYEITSKEISIICIFQCGHVRITSKRYLKWIWISSMWLASTKDVRKDYFFSDGFVIWSIIKRFYTGNYDNLLTIFYR